ncbi:MAG: efflux RND transporter periplasmic adaptor subunit [Planctomycetes bacterium]|nr:efflux RND transporter periplasmic adaptor subunit [Planctomycetota bacterium]
MNNTITDPNEKPTSLLRRGLSALPTAVVLLGLAALGVWGHHTGWKAPRFSELFGNSEVAEQEDWCEAHSVPDSKCIACHPELAGESGADWCKEHGVPESRCTICHPEILKTGVAGDWCAEHGVPESGCTICHPEIARHGGAPVQESETKVSPGSHEGEDELAHLGGATDTASAIRDPRTCQKHALRVQFASTAAMDKAGVVLGEVVERAMTDSLVVNGEVDYDRTSYVQVSSRATGIASRVETKLGESVATGALLALIDSAELGRAKADLLEALASTDVTARALERIERSAGAGFRTESERLEAEAAARQAKARLFSARQALETLGLTLTDRTIDPEALATLGLPESMLNGSAVPPPVGLLPVRSPIEGVVVGLQVVPGESVETGRVLFEVADTRRMWVTMDVPLSEAHRIGVSQQVAFRPDDARDEVVHGDVSWISTAVDEMTRTLKVRAEVENREGALRAHTFGRAQVIVRTSPQAIAVPTEAVQWEGCCYVVFVRIADEIFQTRKVRIGARDASHTEVLVGVLPGEVVVTEGSHVLKSEILKSALGAGCVDD